MKRFLRNVDDDDELVKLKSYYNGYSFALTEPTTTPCIFNPFAITSYYSTGKVSKFWSFTSSEKLAVQFPDILKLLPKLPISVPLEQLQAHADYKSISTNSEFTMTKALFESGYLTATSITESTVLLNFPNQEIKDTISSELAETIDPKNNRIKSNN